MSELFLGDQFDNLETALDAWLGELADGTDGEISIERGTVDNVPDGVPLWLVRMRGQAKDTITIWFSLRQRTLAFDTHLVPAPTAEPTRLWQFLLRRNTALVSAHYGLAAADAVHLGGSLPDHAVGPDELDRVLGTVYDTVERDFATIVSLAFGDPDGADAPVE